MTPATLTIPTVRHDAPTLSRTTLEVALLSLREHASGIRPWAALPDEHDARRSLAIVEGAIHEVAAALEVAT